jgi:hypothetical protein
VPLAPPRPLMSHPRATCQTTTVRRGSIISIYFELVVLKKRSNGITECFLKTKKLFQIKPQAL